MNIYFKIAAIALGLLVVNTACESDEFESSASKASINLGGEITNIGIPALVIDENNPNNTYSRIDSVSVYGYGADIILPDSLKDCDLKVVISAKIRESDMPNSSIAVSLHGVGDSIYYWGEVYSGRHIKQPNNWVKVSDTLVIDRPSNKMRSKHLKIFSRKINGKGYFDVDDLIVEFIRE